MDLGPSEVGYFIAQVGMSAASFGVATDDITSVGDSLTKLFAYRCTPPNAIVPQQSKFLQSICIADTCPLGQDSVCEEYGSVSEPTVANATLANGEGSNGTSNGNITASTTGATGTVKGPKATASPTSAGGSKLKCSIGALVVAIFALAL